MKALFLRRTYLEKTKKSNNPMTIVEIYKLPSLDQATGEVRGGEHQQYFFSEKDKLNIGADCKFGDLVDIRMVLDEVRNVGVPVAMTVIKKCPYTDKELGITA
ncbi:MAG: hypothetical protein LUD27_02700 [Clostridia bacterium]|nr:hypothetical protein [Clostridia bacterium]